jgi:hypothetical protein
MPRPVRLPWRAGLLHTQNNAEKLRNPPSSN